MVNDLLKFTKEGIYCPKGDFWIDPSRKKNTAIITHAHSDHAARGHNEYICHYDTGSLIKLFYGDKSHVSAMDYGDSTDINGVKVTLFPSGHILGAAQVLLEYNGIRAVVAGDYKIEEDGVTPKFTAVPCDIFVTESTFAKPHYNWEPQEIIMQDINAWWKENQKKGTTSVLLAYSLGKSQRILGSVDSSIGDIFVSDQITNINGIYERSGARLAPTKILEPFALESSLGGALVIVASTKAFACLQKLETIDIKRVSGWVEDSWFGMGGFAISDHCDWKGLLTAIKGTGASQIYVQHGFTSYFTKYLRGEGYDAYDVEELKKRSGELDLF